MTRHEIKWMQQRFARYASWRERWEEVRGTPGMWKLIREIYAVLTPAILDGERISPYVVDWDFTPIENDLWCSIRQFGLPFWPQYPVGRFFIDFADPVQRLALECDGRKWHNKEKDEIRDKEIKALGWRVYRFPGWQCFKGQDDEESAHKRLLSIANSYYPLGVE